MAAGAALKSLEEEYPILDSNFHSFCASHGIFTVQDFLLHDLDVLAAFAGQQPNPQRLKEGITQVLSIIDEKHQPWKNGMDLLEDAKVNKHVLSTGLEGMDLVLQGGLRQGQLTELVGPSSSGKTQVSQRVASNVAKDFMGKVVYIDTGNSFSSQRIEQFIAQISDPVFHQPRDSIVQEVMSCILCHSVFDIFALCDVLHQLEINLRSQVNGDSRVRLLIVDSFSSLITPILGGGGSQGHALMTSAGFLLKKLAHEHNVAILVTNHMVGGEGGNSKPALGDSWKSIPHVRLLLSRDRESNIYSVSVLKHPSLASGKAALFMIDGQIQSVGKVIIIALEGGIGWG